MRVAVPSLAKSSVDDDDGRFWARPMILAVMAGSSIVGSGSLGGSGRSGTCTGVSGSPATTREVRVWVSWSALVTVTV